MQYVPDGPIACLSDEGSCAPMSLSSVAHYVKQLAGALHYMHRKGVAHGDIKPDNILVDHSGAARAAYFADFGVSRAFKTHLGQSSAAQPERPAAPTHDWVRPDANGVLGTSLRKSHVASWSPQYSPSKPGRPPAAAPTSVALPVPTECTAFETSNAGSDPRSSTMATSSASTAANSSCSLDASIRAQSKFQNRRASHCVDESELLGTPAFLSPEVFLGAAPGFPADMWAFGVTLYVLIFGRLPFAGDSYFAVKASVLAGEVRFPPAPPQARKWEVLILELLHPDPAERLTARKLHARPLQYFKAGSGIMDGSVVDAGDAHCEVRRQSSVESEAGSPRHLLTDVTESDIRTAVLEAHTVAFS
jgi:serine/threonine protein kinase